MRMNDHVREILMKMHDAKEATQLPINVGLNIGHPDLKSKIQRQRDNSSFQKYESKDVGRRLEPMVFLDPILRWMINIK